MNNLSENNDDRKRKSDFTLNRDLSTLNEEVVPQRATFESMQASEDQMKKRKILKIIRVGEAPSEEVPKGKFQFNFNPSTNQNQIHTNVEDKVKVSTPNLNSTLNEANMSIKKGEENTDKQLLNSEVKEKPVSQTNFTNPFVKDNTISKGLKAETSHNEASIKNEEGITCKQFENKEPKSLPENPFKTQSNILSSNPFVKFNQGSTSSSNQPNKPSILSNPFLNYAKGDQLINNPFLQTKKPTDSIFNTGESSFKPTGGMKFNFNLANAESNPNWNSDDEEEGDNVNPEEEIKIDEKDTSVPKSSEPTKSNSIKVYKRTLENLAEYNFTEKKYIAKGKGEFTLEIPKSEKLMGLAIYRNQVLSILFQGIVVPSVTSYEESMKNYKYYAVINKLLVLVDDKKQFKSVKLAFMSQKDLEDFKNGFNESIRILKENDTSILKD